MFDIYFRNFGHFWSIDPATPAGREWVEKYVVNDPDVAPPVSLGKGVVYARPEYGQALFAVSEASGVTANLSY